MTVRPTDMLIVSAHNKVNDSYNYLKIAIAEELKDGCLNIYSCLEIPLRYTPLSFAWTDCGLKDGQKGNFMAVGTRKPEIEIWDLDTVDGSLEPHSVLGGKSKDKKCEGKKTLRYKKGSHTDSVIHIAWNMEYKNILASASADKTVKIWNVNVGECVSTLGHHNSKVQAVVWCQRSPEIILSGSFDKTVALKDVKNCALDCIKWSVEAIVEIVAWDPHNEHLFVFLATASEAKMVKLWDISNNQPSCISSLDPKVGLISSASFSNDRPFLLAVGGQEGDVTVWDTLAETSVAKHIGKHGIQTDASVAKRKVYHCG